jgi:uncharacterized membrane protein YfcA
MPVPTLVLIAFAGLGASFVDGSLGMGYGVTSATLLIALGLSPALASASVQMAKIGTAAISGVAHHRFGNVDWPTVRRIALPGAIGSFAGATVLSALATDIARPLAGAVLFLLGVYVVIRFTRGQAITLRGGRPRRRLLLPLGLTGGFIDATGGGGWGPVTTPILLADGRLEPRRVIGTVSAAEFIVALSATAGFLLGLGLSGLDLGYVAALLIGGAIAAPFAAAVVRHLNPRVLGVIVGGVIALLNARILLGAVEAAPLIWQISYSVLVLGWLTVVTCVLCQALRQRRARRASEEASVDLTPSGSTARSPERSK